MAFNAAAGSVVLVRDAEWLVTNVDQACDGYFAPHCCSPRPRIGSPGTSGC